MAPRFCFCGHFSCCVQIETPRLWHGLLSSSHTFPWYCLVCLLLVLLQRTTLSLVSLLLEFLRWCVSRYLVAISLGLTASLALSTTSLTTGLSFHHGSQCLLGSRGYLHAAIQCSSSFISFALGFQPTACTLRSRVSSEVPQNYLATRPRGSQGTPPELSSRCAPGWRPYVRTPAQGVG